MESYVLVIAEKPDAARKIALALGHVSTANSSRSFFEVPKAFDGNSYLVCSALGHLYEIADPELERSVFPTFDVDWFPKITNGRNRFRIHTGVARRLELIAHLALRAIKIVNACDYDIEGETIGANIIEFACKNSRIIMRAKFSTLVESEIRNAFCAMREQEGAIASAGRLRHNIDFQWGVNLSRALTKSATASVGAFSNVTVGRVQGPALAFVVQRELENQIHIPTPYWNIVCSLKTDDSILIAKYARSPINSETEANTICDSVSREESALVTSVRTFALKIPPRYPFNLGELQREAFYAFHFSPSTTLRLAEKLYLAALISYPRTDSQKLPQSIQPLNILEKIGKNPEYSDLLKSLFAERSMRKIPWQGTRLDPAHPAIYPTGIVPKSPLPAGEKRLFDLIVRRFCNNFAPDAVIEKRKTSFDIASHEFVQEEERLVDEGWMKYYPFGKKQNTEFTNSLVIGERPHVENTATELLYSKAPPRLSEGSLLAKMESEGVGTKATRADVISTLISRGYLSKLGLVPSENALNLFFELKERCAEVVSSKMTKALEKQLQLLNEQDESEESVLVESLTEIRNSLRKLKTIDRFRWLSTAKASQTKQLLGMCPKCLEGQLYAMRSFRTRKRFVRCNNIKCGASSPLPPRGTIGRTESNCNKCGWPLIMMSFTSGKHSSQICSNYFCKQDDIGVNRV